MIDTFVAVAALADDIHNESLVAGISMPIATGYGVSALVGSSRNQGARTAYTTANPGWEP